MIIIIQEKPVRYFYFKSDKEARQAIIESLPVTNSLELAYVTQFSLYELVEYSGIGKIVRVL